MAVTKVVPIKPQTLREAAEGVWDRAKNVDEAEKILRNIIINNKVLREQLTSWAVRQWIREVMHLNREEAMRGQTAAAANPDDTRGLTELAKIKLNAMMDKFQLSDGTFLGDATKKELLFDAQQREKLADTNARRAAFLRAIAERLKGQQQVRAVLKEADLQKLKKQAGL